MEWLVLLGAAALAFFEAILLIRMLALYVVARRELSQKPSTIAEEPAELGKLRALVEAAQEAQSRAEARADDVEKRLAGMAGGSEIAGLYSQVAEFKERLEAVTGERQDVHTRLEQLDLRVGEVAGLVQRSSQALDHDRLEQAEEAAKRSARVEESIQVLREQIAGMLRDGDNARQAVEGVRAELREPVARISSESLAPEPDVTSASGEEQAAQPGTLRSPRMLSATARARYQDVVDLWSRGNSARTIAMMTGLDFAEVELMLSGERQPGEPPQ